MSALAVENNALNLGQGFPGFSMDKSLIDLVHNYMIAGYNQYSPMPGVMALRERISLIAQELHGGIYNPASEITITSGATQAIFTAISALIHENDEVILFAPAYDCYAPAVELQGGKCVWMNLEWPDYGIEWEHFKKLINHKTRMVIINSPHNPSGRMLSDSDMTQLAHILEGTDIILLSDEVYEHLVLDNNIHFSAARYPTLRDRSLIVGSFGKTLHCTGWKTGYIMGPQHLMIEFRKVHQYNVFVANTPIQMTIAEYLEQRDTYLHLSAFYQQKRDRFLKGIATSDWIPNTCQGAYFQNLQFKKLSTLSDIEFAKVLTIQHKITAIPCSVFYPDHHDESVLRFCFAKSDEDIDLAIERLNKIRP